MNMKAWHHEKRVLKQVHSGINSWIVNSLANAIGDEWLRLKWLANARQPLATQITECLNEHYRIRPRVRK